MSTASGDLPPERLRRLPTRLLSQAATRGRRVIARRLGRFRTYDYALLTTLGEYGPASQAELGRRCGMDRSDVVATVNGLAAEGLVARAPDPADRRRNVITRTDRGADACAFLDAQVDAGQDEVLAALTEHERACLIELLTKVVEADADGRAAW